MNKRFAFTSARWTKSVRPSDTSSAVMSRFDVGSALDCGKRDYQQDTLVADFPAGDDYGIAVLADGMGGHQGGEIASALAVGEAFAELKTRSILCRAQTEDVTESLRSSVHRANTALADYLSNAPETRGMGTTLVACMTVGPDLYWASVGDSLLYLYRDGNLERLNADHSMAPSIDAMVATGMLDEEQALNHPQRNQLLSAICGAEYKYLDCPDTPTRLKAGDILVMASDGLQTLSDADICDCIEHFETASAADISKGLLETALNVEHPEQDNISVIALKVENDGAISEKSRTAQKGTTQKSQSSISKKTTDEDIEEASDLLNEAFFG
ncbi:PP2C family protein-serine/threonine phosphatase [Marivita sp. S0852]|uniref:PP2C family protein-serine/threonine phosphatase n=1 Tax=Marivita sp. S0852 TaxID=3373893 RepID=UPI0039824BC1